MIWVLGIYALSCHVILVYFDKTYRDLGTLHLSCQYVILNSKWLYNVGIGDICALTCHVTLVHFDKTYQDLGTLHLSCQYVIITSEWLYNVGIGNKCFVLSCHTSLFRQDILGPWNITLVMSICHSYF